MEDRYLYKAKQTDTGEWVEGYYTYYPDGMDNTEDTKHVIRDTSINPNKLYFVDESTICRCTGLRDKNDKLIWENDIVSFEDTGEEEYEYKEGFDFINRAKVEFAEGRWSLTDFASDNSGVMAEMYDHAEFMKLWKECEAIGNIFDNPELLEVGE